MKSVELLFLRQLIYHRRRAILADTKLLFKQLSYFLINLRHYQVWVWSRII